MASTRRVSLMAGSAAIAAALVSAVPVQAEEVLTQTSLMAGSADAVVAVNEADHASDVEAISIDMQTLLAQPTTAPEVAETEVAETEVEQRFAFAPIDQPALTTAATLMTAEDTGVPAIAQVEGSEVAQVTRPLYRGVSPFYLGLGGNIGIIDSDESGVGDFGFAIISKISFGPRFSIRPSVIISEDDSSLLIPITYNFNPLQFGEFSVYPSVGGGVDIGFGGGVGALINAGIDIPISRDFTLNAQTNFRVTNDVGLGIILGVGYNFPFFFE
jgi:hypothetical protein